MFKHYEFVSDSQPVSVRGNLARSIDFWTNILDASPAVCDIVRNGYKLPFSSYPPKAFLDNNKSSLNEPDFVDTAISELLRNGCAEELETPPYCVNPLTVAKGKKLRLVLNLRHVNKFLVKPKFKYEDLKTLSQMFDKGYWFFTWDLKSGYHHIDICPEHRTYLGFAWRNNGILRFFQFNVLPFGLSTACYCFTKLLRPLVRRWRSMSHASIVFLDDGISGHPTKCDAYAASKIQQKDLFDAGLTANPEKCDWKPRQKGEWLGMLINTVNMRFEIPPSKIIKSKTLVKHIIDSKCATYRELAKIAGFIISLSLAVGPATRLFTRQMYFSIVHRTSWDQKIFINSSLEKELQFWHKNLDYFQGYPIKEPVAACPAVYTDASDTGYGGYTVTLGTHVAHGICDLEDSLQSSTYRELKAILLVTRSLQHILANRKIKVFTDNQSTACIVCSGSSKPDLQDLAVKLYDVCVQHQIILQCEWIPRTQNTTVDTISRIVDLDDWKLNPKLFQILDEKWGPHTIDRFASSYNTQLPRFNSRFWSPGSEATDAFTLDWANENNWLCPPVNQIVKVIAHLRTCKSVGTLIVPFWPSAPFWPVLVPQPGVFLTGVVDYVSLPLLSDTFIPGRGQCIVYKSKPSIFTGKPSFPLFALRLRFTDPPALCP